MTWNCSYLDMSNFEWSQFSARSLGFGGPSAGTCRGFGEVLCIQWKQFPLLPAFERFSRKCCQAVGQFGQPTFFTFHKKLILYLYFLDLLRPVWVQDPPPSASGLLVGAWLVKVVESSSLDRHTVMVEHLTFGPVIPCSGWWKSRWGSNTGNTRGSPMAKVEPMGSHQHETYSQLALQESGENPQPQNVMPVMPMVDIRGKWQEVAVDVLITMCCLLPGIGFLFGCWLLYKYGKLWWQEKSCLDRMGLAYLGFWLVFGPLLTAIHFWRQAQLFSKGHLDLKTIVGSWQINFLLDAIWIGSSLAWLILETNKHQVEQSVCEHKKRNKKILEGPKGNPRAKDLLDTLQGSFPQQFPKDTDIKAGSVQLCSLSGCVLWASTAVIPLLMFAVLMDMAKVHCEIHHPQKCATHLVAETRYIIWIANGVRICLTTLHWKKLMTGVLITTSVHMRMNYCELLLFTALTPTSKGLNSLWSERNLETLKEIVQAALRGSPMVLKHLNGSNSFYGRFKMIRSKKRQ